MKKRRAFRTPDKLQKIYKRASEGKIKVLGELIEYIKQHLANPMLSVQTISRDIKMCRVSLYKKLLMLTGKSPVDSYVRSGSKKPFSCSKIHK